MKTAAACLFLLLLLCPPAFAQAPLLPPVPPELLPLADCPAVDDWGTPGALRVAGAPGGMRVSWIPSPEQPTRAEGFQVVRSTGLAGPWETVAVVHETVNAIVDETAVPDTLYYYRVRAFQEGLCSPFSDPVRGIRQ